jgi:hypothetical protein
LLIHTAPDEEEVEELEEEMDELEDEEQGMHCPHYPSH